MKHLFSMVALAFLGIATVQAQDEVSFGAKAGLNIASLSGDDVDDLDSRTGFHIGAVVEIPISEKFSVQPELMYSQQGAKSEEEFDGVTAEGTIRLDYINIPVLAKFYVAEGFSLEAGPQFGFNAKAETEFEVSGGGIEAESETEDIKDDISGFDFGGALGAGYELNNGLFFQTRYVFGFSDVNDSDGGDEDDGDAVRNGTFSVSVGFKF